MKVIRNDVAAGRASAHVSLANVVTSVLGAVLFAFLPRILTAVELGIIAAVTLSYTVFQFAGQVGLNRAASSLISNALVDSKGAAGRVIWGIVLMSIGFSVITAIPAYLLASRLSELTLRNVRAAEYFQVGAVVVLVNVLASNLEGVMQGIRDFALLAESRVAGQAIRIVISLVLLFSGYRVLAIIVGLFFGQYGLVSIFIQVPILLKRFRFVIPTLKELGGIIRYSLPLWGVTILSLVSLQLDLIILISQVSTSRVGIYFVVLNVVQAVTLGLIFPIQGSLVPFMSKVLREKGKLEQAFQRGTRYMSFVAVPTVVALASASQIIVLIIAGPRYLEASLPLAIAFLALIPAGFSGLSNATLQSHGRNTQILLSMLGSAALAVLLGFPLVGALGLVGAATIRIVFYSTYVGLGMLMLRSTMRVGVDKTTLWKMTLASCAFLIVPIQYAIWHTLVGLAISTTIALLAFLGALKILRAISQEDVDTILGSIPPSMSILARILRLESLAAWLVA